MLSLLSAINTFQLRLFRLFLLLFLSISSLLSPARRIQNSTNLTKLSVVSASTIFLPKFLPFLNYSVSEPPLHYFFLLPDTHYYAGSFVPLCRSYFIFTPVLVKASVPTLVQALIFAKQCYEQIKKKKKRDLTHLTSNPFIHISTHSHPNKLESFSKQSYERSILFFFDVSGIES